MTDSHIVRQHPRLQHRLRHQLQHRLPHRLTHRRSRRRRDDGFTLVEILIAIVLVGVLAAVVVVGISRLTDTASAASCATSADAARTGANAVLVNTGAYPTSFAEMTTAVGGATAPLVIPEGASQSADQISFGTWTLTMSAGAPPRFACSARQSTPPTTVSPSSICPAATGWQAEYYANISLTGPVTACRDEPAVNSNWGSGAPFAGIPDNNFSVRWSRNQSFAAGTYKFSLGTDDGGRLYIDGVLVINIWSDQSYPGVPPSANRTLSSGTHTIVVEYYERGGDARATLVWS